MECPICMEIFRVPLLLPGCGHTICQACAELLITDGKRLQCPECRLLYELKHGIQSLPKNIALQRTIDEHNHQLNKSVHDVRLTCSEHQGDVLSLYCRTCDKAICLKCYFSQKGKSVHSGHEVDTKEDVLTREKRIFEENFNHCLEMVSKESQLITVSEEKCVELQSILEKKLLDIEKSKSELVSKVKKYAAKLKFTLKGTAAKEEESLRNIIRVASERKAILDKLVEETVHLKDQLESESYSMEELKAVSKKLEVLPSTVDFDTATVRAGLTNVAMLLAFETDIKPCLSDPKQALALQTEVPRIVEIDVEKCIISSTKVLLHFKYTETVRTKVIVIQYKEALYKGLSEKQWLSVNVHDFRRGNGTACIAELLPATVYRLFIRAHNDLGQSPLSAEIRFRTASEEPEIRIV